MEQLDLTGVTQFLEERDLVPEKYCRYYLHWIRRFLTDPRASSPALTEEDCLRGDVGSVLLFAFIVADDLVLMVL